MVFMNGHSFGDGFLFGGDWVTDKEYFKWWHIAQQARNTYDSSNQPTTIVDMAHVGWITQRPVSRSYEDHKVRNEHAIGVFLDEYNKRHDIKITVQDYLAGSMDEYERLQELRYKFI